MKRKIFWEIVRLSFQMGFLIALPISGGAILGYFLDAKLDTAPILTLILLLSGVFLAFWIVLKRIRDIENASH